jgi:branched-chain amino acid transport system ATP-binding protein|tara:strand:- start:5613 stop:6401 length:789 start_codon:yes stop_codon:yes gene_type:complete
MSDPQAQPSGKPLDQGGKLGVPGAPLLQLSGVHTHIDQYHILQGVDLVVPRGGITMLLGRNGAGKTTTMRTIMGLWRASQGRVDLAGEEINQLATPDRARRGMAYVPESMAVFSGLTVKENLTLAARSGTFDPDRLAWIFEVFPAMKTFWDLPAGNLSGGQKQMLAISRAMIEPRELLLVDEPSKGLAPAIVQSLIEAFRQLKQADTTILLVEQNFHMATSLGDSVAIMDDGQVVHNGAMDELANNRDLQQSLLGLSMDSHQ